MKWLAQDLRYAARTLVHSPAYSIVAIATLALAIGATAAIFTILNSVLLRPLGYPDSDSLVVLWERVPSISSEPTGPNPRHFDRWQQRTDTLSDFTLFRYSSAGLTLSSGHPQLVGTVTCLPNFFSTLGVTPMLGRGFVREDGIAGQDASVILTYGMWQTLFNGDRAIVGRTVRIGDVPREVIGVLPPDFHFASGNALRSFRSGQATSSLPEPGVFLPAVMDFTNFGWNSDYGNWVALARLRRGVSLLQARTQLSTVQAQLATEQGIRFANGLGLDAFVEPLQEAIVRDSRRGVWLLMAAVSALMLIGCVNLANAQLGRVLRRNQDSAVRVALGASRARVLIPHFTESALLTAVGTVAGIALAAAGIRVFRNASPLDIPRVNEIGVDWIVILFAVAVAALTMIASGLLPALAALRTDPQRSLQRIGRGTTGRNSRAVRAWLIGAQVAGCSVLLVVTGLFAQSLRQLLNQDTGFNAQNVAIAEVRLPANTYASPQSRVAFDAAVLENIRRIPGIEAAGLVSTMPLEGETWIESLRRTDALQQDTPLVNLRWVSAGYFEALRQPVIAGRTFDERDARLRSIVISNGESRALFGSENPIGREVTAQGRKFTVIGVVGDSHSTSLKTAPVRIAYAHYTDRPPYSIFFTARGAQSAESLIANMRDAIWQHAPAVTIARVTTMEMQMARSLAAERFQTVVLAVFGASALLLAMLGIYGVLSYAVTSRRREIGLRIALGATRTRIYSLAFADAARPVIGGLAVGIVVSLAGKQLVLKSIYGITGIGSLVVSAVIAVLIVSAGVAAFPALRRAASVDPIETLRAE